MCEPLKDKIVYAYNSDYQELEECLQSAVKGLIKYHEDIIETLIKGLSDCSEEDCYTRLLFNEIEIEYYALQVIEYWLEDAI